MKKEQTNVEFVTEIMEFSRYGAMAQLFIIDAIEKWSKHIASMPIEKLREQFGDNPFLSADSWYGVAREINEKCEQRYK